MRILIKIKYYCMKDRKVFVIRASDLNEKEEALIVSLQGLVNLKEPRLIIDVDHYLEFLESNVKFIYISFDECLNMFLPEISEAITYNLSRDSTEINAAFSYSSATGALAVPHGMEEYIDGIPVIEDLSELHLDDVEIQRYVFRKFKDKFAKNGLIHQPISKDGKFLIAIRDYAILKKWAVIYCGESEKERDFLAEVLSSLDKQIPIYGWTTDEISFVDFISKYGDYIIAMDWSSNHSYFGSFQPKIIKRKHLSTKVIPNKHYVCLCLSDGDNIQWLERDFAFGSFFGERNKVERNYPFAFSISPALIDLNPSCLSYIYSKIENEDFVCGVSGYGYMNPCVFPKQYLPGFAKHTNEYFKYSDLQVLVLIDNKKNMSDENVAETISHFAKQTNIIGSLYQVDPICYKGGNGKIYWSNNKPFVTARFSLWNTSVKNDKPEHAPIELLEEIANNINSMPIDETSEEGYSYINVHPWSVHWWDVDKLVSLFNENIQILPADVFIETIKKNVRH